MTSAIPTTMKAAYIEAPGGPDALQVGQQPVPTPGPQQVLIKLHVSTVNYIDTYQRSGLYTLPLPAILGRDGAGTIAQLGANVDPNEFHIDQRVAFFHFGNGGSYAEYCTVDVANVTPLPDELSFAQGATLMVQGLTAHAYVNDICTTKPGDFILIHAAAGGTGSFMVQLAKQNGLIVIGTVGSAAKAEIAKKFGADHVINYNEENFPARVKEITNGKGVRLVLDGVGKSTATGSMESVAQRGYVVFVGNASGPVEPIDPLRLTQYGSIFITRPTLKHYVATREEFLTRCRAVFDAVINHNMIVPIATHFNLDDVSKAHEAIQSRNLAGKIIIDIIPQ